MYRAMWSFEYMNSQSYYGSEGQRAEKAGQDHTAETTISAGV